MEKLNYYLQQIIYYFEIKKNGQNIDKNNARTYIKLFTQKLYNQFNIKLTSGKIARLFELDYSNELLTGRDLFGHYTRFF